MLIKKSVNNQSKLQLFFFVPPKHRFAYICIMAIFLSNVINQWFIIPYFERMSSQQSSFRDMFEYPPQGSDQKHRKYAAKGIRNRKLGIDSNKPIKQSFYDIVQKAKNVAMFTQTLKQKIAQKNTLSQHTLKLNQMDFLQNDSQIETANIYFEYHNKFVFVFQILFIVAIFVYLWNCTLQIVFGNLIQQPIIQIITFVSYLTHIIIFNFTEYKNQKFQFISNRNEVYSIYIKQKITKDCIFLLMVGIELTPIDDLFPEIFIIIRIISLICYMQLSSTCQKIQDLLSVSNQAQTIISMLKLLYKIALFLHCLSIALNVLAILEANSHIQSTWITQNGIQFHTNFDKYVVGWYWGATILSTVGFGQITPKNNFERFFISIVQVICCMTFGYFVNVIGSLIKVKAESEQKYEKQVRSLNRCLNFLSITNDLKHKLRTYFFNRHVIEQVYDPNEEKQMLENLAPNLETALIQQNNINVLKKTQIMQRFKKQTLVKLTHLLKKIILAPQHVIYSRFTKDRKVWFIEKGVIEQFTDNFENSTLKKMISIYNEKESIVGWINFLTQSCYKTIAKAKIFTIAYELQEEGFINTLKDDIKQFHRYLHMKQMMIEKDRKFVHKCLSCDRYTHNAINCPRIHFIRKDIKKLAHQYRHLHKYLDGQNKMKKVERNLIRYDWKVRYSVTEIDKQDSILLNNQANQVQVSIIGSATIENFIKNTMLRPNNTGIQKRKMSFIGLKKQSKLENTLINHVTQPKESKQEFDIKSNFSSDEIIEPEQEEIMFQKVFACDNEIKDYMPDHDIQKVLAAYSNKYTKKLQLEDRIRKFMRK